MKMLPCSPHLVVAVLAALASAGLGNAAVAQGAPNLSTLVDVIRRQAPGLRGAGLKVSRPSPKRSSAESTDDADMLLPVSYYHVKDSDGTTPVAGVDVVLVFEPNGIADVVTAKEDDAIARRGNYLYAAGQLTIKFTADDFHPDVTFSLQVSRDTVVMPFKVFSPDSGSSIWLRKDFPIEHNLGLVFTAATINEQLGFDSAMARVLAYGTAIIRAASRFVSDTGRGDPPQLIRVEPLKNGVRLTYKGHPREDVLFFAWSSSDGAPLQPAVLAGDPRVNLDVASPKDPSADPGVHHGLFIAPFHDAREVVLYSPRFFRPMPVGLLAIHFGEDTLLKLDAMAAVLTSRHYDQVRQLRNDTAGVLNIINELKPPTPGFIFFSTEGGSFGSLVTGDFLGNAADKEGCYAGFDALKKRIEGAGYGDLLTYGGDSAHPATREDPATLQIDIVARDLRPSGYSCFVAVNPDFWRWLREKQGASFEKSLVYIGACYPDNNPDLREGIRARAFFGFEDFVTYQNSGAIFRYLVMSLARHTHSAEESYYNILRISRTRRMIYREDTLFRKLLPKSDSELGLLPKSFHGYGFDEKLQAIVPYQGDGWLTDVRGFDPGAVWWLLFSGRWSGSDVHTGAATMLRCWNQFWKDGKTAGLGDVTCHNRDPGRAPTLDEVAYASYLLTGTSVLDGSRIVMVPRWTLGDGL